MRKSILYMVLTALALCTALVSCNKASKGTPTLEAAFDWGSSVDVVGNFDGTVKVSVPNGIDVLLVTVTLPDATYVQLVGGMINIKNNRPSASNLKAVFDLVNDATAAQAFGLSTSSVDGATSLTLNLAKILDSIAGDASDSKSFPFEVSVEDQTELKVSRKVTFRFIAPPTVTAPANQTIKSAAAAKTTFEAFAPGKVGAAVLSVSTSVSSMTDILRGNINIAANKTGSPYKMDLIEDNLVINYFKISATTFKDKTSKVTFNISNLIDDFVARAEEGDTMSVTLSVTDSWSRSSSETVVYTMGKK